MRSGALKQGLLELKPQADACAAALEFPPTQPGVEALEVENDVIVQPAVDSRNRFSLWTASRLVRSPPVRRRRRSRRIREPQAEPETQVARRRLDRNLKFRHEQEIADGDHLVDNQIAGIVACLERLHPVAGMADVCRRKQPRAAFEATRPFDSSLRMSTLAVEGYSSDIPVADGEVDHVVRSPVVEQSPLEEQRIRHVPHDEAGPGHPACAS